MRVKSRKPPAENLITSERVTSSTSAAVPTMLKAIRCGMWLVMASTMS